MNTKKIPVNNKKSMYRLAMMLFFVGIALTFSHYIFLSVQQVQIGESWLISFDTTHTVKQADTVISVQPPYESEKLRLVRRNIAHVDLSIVPPARNSLSKRAIRLRAKQAGIYQTEMEFTLQTTLEPNFHLPVINKLNEKRRNFFLADNEWMRSNSQIIEEKLEEFEFNGDNPEALIDRVFQDVLKLAINNSDLVRNAKDIISSNSANHQERALLMVALSRKVGLPARMVTGIELKDDPSVKVNYWVEIFINERWNRYHPGHGYNNNLPDNLVALDKYGEGLVSGSIAGSVLDSKDYEFVNDISVERLPVTFSSPDIAEGKWHQVFMLDRLPLETREELSLLMLLPLGALLCSFIRQIIGVHSYGVFTPTILALAITYTEAETTVLILIITMSLVYFGRPTFHHEMSRTPRLSIVFTLVATSMVIGVSVLDYFSLASDGHLILLPIVIITSLIDRFFSTVENLSYRTAFVRLAWTVILTLSVLPLLQLSWLGDWILRYPESHLFTLSLMILVSYYTFGKHKIPDWLSLLKEPENKAVR